MDILVIRWGFLEVPVCKWYLGTTFSKGYLVGRYLFLVPPIVPLNPKFNFTKKLGVVSLLGICGLVFNLSISLGFSTKVLWWLEALDEFCGMRRLVWCATSSNGPNLQRKPLFFKMSFNCYLYFIWRLSAF